jgi:hypothetical protein
MFKKSSIVVAGFALCAASVLAGCPERGRDGEADGAAASEAGTDTAVGVDAAGKPLGYGCAAGSECASSFCVDGVCCESACDGQCQTCHVTGALGQCSPQVSGDDLRASQPCQGAWTCALDPTSPNQSACKLKDVQKCSSDDQCASGHCRTFFADVDGDGYGSAKTLRLCDGLDASPPAGYVTQAGDCCDSDAAAHPGTVDYFDSPDACGSFDFNCDGTYELQYQCPGKPLPATCGTLACSAAKNGCH